VCSQFLPVRDASRLAQVSTAFAVASVSSTWNRVRRIFDASMHVCVDSVRSAMTAHGQRQLSTASLR
jgi:hypothetical protein